MNPSAPFRAVLALGGLLAFSCGARTELEGTSGVEPMDADADVELDGGGSDAGPRRDGGLDGGLRDGGLDGGLRDGGPRDGGPRDGGSDAGRDASPDGGPIVGAECRRDLDCTRSLCRRDPASAPRDLAPVPLVCGVPDDASGDGERCDAAADCDRGLCVLAGTCVPPCVEDSDCDEGFECRPVYALTSLSSAQPMNGCVQPLVLHEGVRAETLPPTDVLTRGTLRLPPVPGPGAATLHVVRVDGGSLQPARLTDASGRVLFDLDQAFPGGARQINPIGGFGPVVSLLTPNGSRDVAGVGLALEVDVFPAVRTAVRTTRLLGSAGPTRTLDIDIFYVGGGMLRPERDGTVPLRLRRALGDAERTLAPSRIRFGEIRQHTVPGILRGRLAFIDSGLDGGSGELQELFELGAGSGRSSLPIFLVRDISGALGIAGDIPGAWMHPGEITNGIAISVDAIFDPDPLTPPLGRVIAHETGHYLGLFHTSEADGTIFEALDGTAACGLERDSDGDGWLFAAECEGAGADNVMFWAAQDGALTAEQGTTIGRALVLR